MRGFDAKEVTMNPEDRPDVHRLRDLRFDDGTPLTDGANELWQRGYRLFYRHDGEPGIGNVGGEFVLVEFVMASIGHDSIWDDPDVCVSVLLKGVARFDGVRHMWWTPDSDCDSGYVFCPEMGVLADVLGRIAVLFPDTSR